MAKKRILKRTIHYVCEELFAECAAASLNASSYNTENIAALVGSIVQLQNNYVNRISHPEPGIRQKDYYKDLIENFNKQASEIVDQILNIH